MTKEILVIIPTDAKKFSSQKPRKNKVDSSGKDRPDDLSCISEKFSKEGLPINIFMPS